MLKFWLKFLELKPDSGMLLCPATALKFYVISSLRLESQFYNIQSTLVISNFTGPDKNVRVISSSRQPNCDVIGMTTVRLSVRQTCLEGTCIWQFK